jgi:general secretion pathway protein B
MSSILKALRRLEEERARKSHVAPEIAASLLRDGARRRPSPLWIWPTVMAVVVVLVAALLWSLRPAPVVIIGAKKLLPPAPSPAALSGELSAGRGNALIIEEVIDQRRPVLLPPANPPRAEGVVLPPVKVTAAAPPTETVVKAAAEPIKAAATSLKERQSPVVTAIIWQEESAARMAVVDGLPVMSGETIGTAKIAEIQRDRILFVEGGILFTVRLDAQ